MKYLDRLRESFYTSFECLNPTLSTLRVLGFTQMQELPSRQATPNQHCFNVGPRSTTLDQRHIKIDSTSRVRRAPTFMTFENVESRSPGKTRDHDTKRLHCWATVYAADPTIKQHRSAALIPGAIQASASKNPCSKRILEGSKLYIRQDTIMGKEKQTFISQNKVTRIDAGPH